jgi:hypothetical protein
METNARVLHTEKIVPKWMRTAQTFQKTQLELTQLLHQKTQQKQVGWKSSTLPLSGKKQMPKPAADAMISKWFSRKLLVWGATTGLLLIEKVDADNWVALSLAYIGSQGVADIAAKWKGTHN